MFDGITQIAKRFKLGRRIGRVLPSGWHWTLGALTEKAAMQSAIRTTSTELFDKQGMQLAEELKQKISPNSVVLDFGCGIGRPEKFLSAYCKDIYGADISSGMLRLARIRNKDFKNVHFIKCNKTNLSIFQDCKFDFVFSEAVLQHIAKEHAVLILKELLRVCKSGGRVYLMFCNLLCPINLDNFINYSTASKILTPTRMRYWLPEEVEQLMKKLGFEIISLDLKSDARDEKRDCYPDDYHRNYSIWVLASKK